MGPIKVRYGESLVHFPFPQMSLVSALITPLSNQQRMRKAILFSLSGKQYLEEVMMKMQITKTKGGSEKGE